MVRPAAAFALAVAVAAPWAGGAGAAPARATLGKGSVLYDSAAWRAAPSDGAIAFTCIASDCQGQHVFATVTTARGLAQALAAAQRDSRRLRDDGVPPLPFPALAYWSGCRAQDAPILFSGGQVDDVAYTFVTAITAGCNFGPPLPEKRFLDLLRGFETN